jgi:hypothetical protein
MNIKRHDLTTDRGHRRSPASLNSCRRAKPWRRRLLPAECGLRLEAAVGDGPARSPSARGLAFGKALHAHVSPLQVAERGQPTRVRPRIEPPFWSADR